MAKVITQAEMLQYAGRDEAAFPTGAILTPLAKDYAAANNIRVVFKDSYSNNAEESSYNGAREKLLRDIVLSVKKSISESGRQISNEDLEKMVVACIERIGCSVIM